MLNYSPVWRAKEDQVSEPVWPAKEDQVLFATKISS
jgi:hypothetical protein